MTSPRVVATPKGISSSAPRRSAKSSVCGLGAAGGGGTVRGEAARGGGYGGGGLDANGPSGALGATEPTDDPSLLIGSDVDGSDFTWNGDVTPNRGENRVGNTMPPRGAA